MMRYWWVSLFLLIFLLEANATKKQGLLFTYDDPIKASEDVFKEDSWNFVHPKVRPKKYAIAQEISEPLYVALCAKYKKCKDFPKPEILLSYVDTTGAFAKEVDGKPTQTNAIVLPLELIDTPDQLEFVLAHEMIHYFEEHGTQTTLGEQISAVKKQSYHDCLSYDQPYKLVEGNLVQLIGLVDELGHAPHIVSREAAIPLDGDLGKVLEKMILKNFKKENQCQETFTLFLELKSHNKKGNYLSASGNEFKEFKKKAHTCFESYQGNLLADVLVEEKLFLDLDPNLWPELDDAVKNDTLSEFNRLQTIRNIRYNEYTRLSRELSAPQLRYQSQEDIADIKAIEILIDLGHEKISNRLEYLLSDLPKIEQIRCRDDLKNKREPSYGPLNSVHHSECWRIWRAQKVEQRYRE